MNVPCFAALGSDELRLTLGGGQLVENLVKLGTLTLFGNASSGHFHSLPRHFYCLCHLSRWKPRQYLPWSRESDRNRRPGRILDPEVILVNFVIQGVETVTFKQPTSSDTKHVYTVYVEWTAPIGNEDATFPDTNAWVSLTDGTITEEIHMEAKVVEHTRASRVETQNGLLRLISLDIFCDELFEGLRRRETLVGRLSPSCWRRRANLPAETSQCLLH